MLKKCIVSFYPAYVSKHNSNSDKQVILLMIPYGEGWHYLAVKTLSALLRAITSKHHSDFYCLNYLHSFATENKRESHKKSFENKDVFNVVIFKCFNFFCNAVKLIFVKIFAF